MKIWMAISVFISTVAAGILSYDPIITYFTILSVCMIVFGVKTQGLKWFKNFY